MRLTRRLLTFLLSLVLIFICTFVFETSEATAVSNPYPTQQNVDKDAYYEVPCTWFAWQQVYDNTGKQIHYWGNAVDWWNGAKNSGYATGSTPRPGAIAVWSGDTYGHVAYVTSGSGSTFTVNEGGRTDLDHTDSHGIAYSYTLTNAVGARRPYDTNKILLGFIYPSETSAPASVISWGNFSCQPKNTDAKIEARATAPYTGTFTQAGVVICDNTNKQVASKTENISTKYSYLNIWYNITEEMGVSLRPGSKYYYQYWVVFNGTKYLSPVKSFKTTGTCSHVWVNGTVTKAATYTSEGVKTYTCKYCAGKGTQTLSKLVLKAPNSLSLTTIASSGKPKFSWNKVSGAEKYEVWRKAGSGGTYKRYYTTTGTTMTNKATTPGTIYYYKVRSIREDGTKSAFSATKSIACDLAKPTGLKVTTVASSGKPKVTWNKVSSATTYEVWRKAGSSGTWKKMYTTKGTAYTNTSAKAGTVYYYKVKAICGKNSGGNSAFSASDYVTCDLAKPKITVSGTKQKGKIVISWSKVTGADRYYIYRATSKNGTYKKYGSTTKTTYTNAKVTKGKYYYYKVKAVYDNKSAANSAYSNMDYAWVR